MNTPNLLGRLPLALSLIASSLAYGGTTIVYPTGINPTDVQNVQAAVNKGGSILLKAVDQKGHPQSFNFGTWPNPSSVPANGSVTLNASVSISGERVGANRTTIAGGVSPFYEPNNVPVKVSITGLLFLNPGCDAATIWSSTGFTFANNEVSAPQPYTGSEGYTETIGLFVGGLGNSTITGPVVITGNNIHGLAAAEDEVGIYMNNVESAMSIVGNNVSVGYATADGAGSLDSAAIAIYGCAGAAGITGNNVNVGPGTTYHGIRVLGPAASGAVTLLGNQVTIDDNALCYAAIALNGATGNIQVLANSVDSGSEAADGIALEGNSSTGTISGATVALNAIDIENSDFSAIELIGAVSRSTISLNLITGDSAYAVSAQGDGNPADLASANYFLSNLLLGYSASDATVFFDTNTANNMFVGPYVKAINNGTGNKISR